MNSVSNKKLSKIASDQAASHDPTWVQCIFSPADVRLVPVPEWSTCCFDSCLHL